MKSITFLAVLSLHPTLACMNSPSMEKSLHGWSSEGHFISYHLEEAMKGKPEDRKPKLSDRSDPQDAAVAKILSGDLATGIELLQAMEAKKPGNYDTAANLGTAFELSGNNEKSLTWIKEGIKRNPKSHAGTEWLHVLILEAKLAVQNGKANVDTERLIPVTEDVQKDTQLTIHGEVHKADDVMKALSYQLTERMIFVKPTDRWVAECLYSLAILQASAFSIQDGLRLLDLASKYGFPDQAAIHHTKKRFEQAILWGEVKSWTLTATGVVAILWILFCAFRKLKSLLSD